MGWTRHTGGDGPLSFLQFLTCGALQSVLFAALLIGAPILCVSCFDALTPAACKTTPAREVEA